MARQAGRQVRALWRAGAYIGGVACGGVRGGVGGRVEGAGRCRGCAGGLVAGRDAAFGVLDVLCRGEEGRALDGEGGRYFAGMENVSSTPLSQVE